MILRRALLAAFVAIGAAACSRGEAGTPPGVASGSGPSGLRASPTDAAGLDARRIVSLAPSTTESLFVIGAGDRLVGRSRYCDWPPEVARLPVVGGLHPDLETILELSPDLVVGPQTSSLGLEEQLASRGVATFFPPVESLKAIHAALLGLGERSGHAREAARAVADLEAREAAAERAVAGATRPRVLMIVGIAPVVAAGASSYVDELLRRAGGENVVTDGPAWPVLGFEKILELDPDIVLDGSAGPDGAVHATPQATGWSAVRAVRRGNVVAMNDPRVMRPGPRIADGLAVLARALHPDRTIP
jgi:iron complex transport system substrate-binding protein